MSFLSNLPGRKSPSCTRPTDRKLTRGNSIRTGPIRTMRLATYSLGRSEDRLCRRYVSQGCLPRLARGFFFACRAPKKNPRCLRDRGFFYGGVLVEAGVEAKGGTPGRHATPIAEWIRSKAIWIRNYGAIGGSGIYRGVPCGRSLVLAYKEDDAKVYVLTQWLNDPASDRCPLDPFSFSAWKTYMQPMRNG
jgi:hypothetical protein